HLEPPNLILDSYSVRWRQLGLEEKLFLDIENIRRLVSAILCNIAHLERNICTRVSRGSQLSDFRGRVPKIGKNCPRTNDSSCAPSGRHSAFLRRTPSFKATTY